MEKEKQHPEAASEKAPASGRTGRKFRVGRRVKSPPVEPYSTQVLRELEQEEDADRGTPEMDRSLREGCGGCLNVSLLFLVIILASIITTFLLRK